MSGKDSGDKPSKIKRFVDGVIDRIMDITETDDLIDTTEKEGFKLRGQSADVYIIECNAKTKNHKKKT